MKLVYEGALDTELWNGRKISPGTVVECTDDQAAELLAVHPDKIAGKLVWETGEDGVRRRVKRDVPHPEAGKPLRPGWKKHGSKTKATTTAPSK